MNNDAVLGLSSEEHDVYEEVLRAGSLGAFHRDISRALNIGAQVKLKPIFDKLQHLKLIVPVKNIHHARRVCYIATKFEADSSVTGGALYDSEGKFNDRLIGAVESALLRYIRSRSEPVNITQLKENLARQSATVPQSISVLQVANSLSYNLGIAQCPAPPGNEDTSPYFEKFRWDVEFGVAEFPCLKCPEADLCQPYSEISPETCPYLKKWTGIEEKKTTLFNRAGEIEEDSICAEPDSHLDNGNITDDSQ